MASRQRLIASSGILGGVALDAFAPAPEHVDLRAELCAQIDGVHGLLQRIGAHLGIIGGEGTILESRIVEKVCSGHGNTKTGLGQSLL